MAFYSILHFFVDGVCAAAMFGNYMLGKDGYLWVLIYNFCAFALQMPFGVVLDALNAEETRKTQAGVRHAVSIGGWEKRKNWSLMTAIAGVLCTIAGAVTNPVILGIGNALFHVGGGVGIICGGRKEESAGEERRKEERRQEESRKESRREEDREERRKRQLVRLGIFVAPGALGLYVGMLLAKSGGRSLGLLCGSAAMLLIIGTALCGRLWDSERRGRPGVWQGQQNIGKMTKTAVVQEEKKMQEPAVKKQLSGSAEQRGIILLSISCLLVVILRSYVGMAVTFPWKTGIIPGLAAVFAIAGGKAAGGFLASWKGAGRTAAVSLIAASVCYLFSSAMPVGLAALFLFNMTMPITLYWMICALPNHPRFAFGFLTFGLFLGFLPGYLNAGFGLAGNVIGGVGSLLSLLILAVGLRMYRRNEGQSI